MKLALIFLLASSGIQFDITDARGKKPSGVTIEAGSPDGDGWFDLKVSGKPKTQPVLIWPFDGKARPPQGPGAVPAIVIEHGDTKALMNPRVVAAVLAALLLLGLLTFLSYKRTEIHQVRLLSSVETSLREGNLTAISPASQGELGSILTEISRQISANSPMRSHGSMHANRASRMLSLSSIHANEKRTIFVRAVASTVRK